MDEEEEKDEKEQEAEETAEADTFSKGLLRPLLGSSLPSSTHGTGKVESIGRKAMLMRPGSLVGAEGRAESWVWDRTGVLVAF